MFTFPNSWPLRKYKTYTTTTEKDGDVLFATPRSYVSVSIDTWKQEPPQYGFSFRSIFTSR